MSTQTADTNKKTTTKENNPTASASPADGAAIADSKAETTHMLSFGDIESLDQLRGELALQAHLLRAELRERFEKTEKDWSVLDLHLAPLKTATSKATEDVSAAVRLLFDTVKSGYQDIKNAATSQH